MSPDKRGREPVASLNVLRGERPGEGAWRSLASRIAGEVRPGAHDRMLYATDASIYQVEPLAVAIPASVEDAAIIVDFCAEQGLPILPRGGGTSLAGQCVNRAVTIDCSPNMREVGAVDARERRVYAHAGAVLDELNGELRRRGHALFFAPDVATSSHATIGGMIGNNSAGARSVRYGHTVDHVRAIDALLVGDEGARRVRFERAGDTDDPLVRDLTCRVCGVVREHEALIRERFPTTRRRVSGYSLDRVLAQLDRGGEDEVNLCSLLCGSEGTLAVTLGAELNLEPRPAARRLTLLGFRSLDEAIAAVRPALATDPSAVELIDDVVIDLARRSPHLRGACELLPGASAAPHAPAHPPGAVLYVEHAAEDGVARLEEAAARLRDAVPDAPVRVIDAEGDMERAWALRKAAEPLLHAIEGPRKPVTFVEDPAVDPAKLTQFVRAFKEIVERHGTRAAFFGHASVGVLHIRPLLDLHDPADEARLRAIAVEIADLAKRFGGALSGEHGDGRVRGPLLRRYFGPELVAAFAQIKHIFDPLGLLNPGVLVDPGPVESITQRTRVAPEGRALRARNTQTFFEYDDQESFSEAVERCNGAGVCRKRAGGTMCPSYRATLDERHSTRGRGNALRLAVTGQLANGPGPWRDDELKRTLDLCLSCKACKSECPSGVDVARLKAEALAQGFLDGARPTLLDRAVARLRTIQRVGAIAPGLANRLAASRLRGAASKAMGLSASRPVPPFGASLRSIAERGARPRNGRRPRVALFQDCFTGFGENAIGLDAVRALEALGYDVTVIDAGCCARPAISRGLLARARRQSAATLRRLSRLARRCEAIVVLEPSCASSFQDDLVRLKSPVSRALRESIASRTTSFESFVESRRGGRPDPHDPHDPPLRGAAAGRVLLHTHCHQKASGDARASETFLRRLVGDGLDVLDAGCCGVAGAFGYERAHEKVSMKIGELALLPAVRAAPEDAIIVATGASCRRQVIDGAGREALHPAQVAAARWLDAEEVQP